jgi:hypothetical protein
MLLLEVPEDLKRLVMVIGLSKHVGDTLYLVVNQQSMMSNRQS